MTVIRTDEWLSKHYSKPLKLCEKLTDLFSDASAAEIHHHFIQHGMYEKPTGGQAKIEKLKEANMWEIVKKEEKQLKSRWNGPDIPIFIFPAETNNRQLLREYNGKSGLSFKDKLFLFVSEHNSAEEIRALYTHEYNHVCRLSKLNKREKNFVLLDLIIMEGLAENAVREQLGEKVTAAWTNFYTDRQLDKIWNNIVLPHRDVHAGHPKQQQILYGLKWYPKMAGYACGYYLVKKYIEKNNVSIDEILALPSEEIAGLSSTET